jgi:hypothetical protein
MCFLIHPEIIFMLNQCGVVTGDFTCDDGYFIIVVSVVESSAFVCVHLCIVNTQFTRLFSAIATINYVHLTAFTHEQPTLSGEYNLPTIFYKILKDAGFSLPVIFSRRQVEMQTKN